ncbi:unnamed protein product [Caretta caretta]
MEEDRKTCRWCAANGRRTEDLLQVAQDPLQVLPQKGRRAGWGAAGSSSVCTCYDNSETLMQLLKLEPVCECLSAAGTWV